MRIVAIQNTVAIVVGQKRIPLVTLESTQQTLHALRWTRKFETAIEGASALLDYCNGKGLKPKGRKIAKKHCPELAGLKANYK